MALITVSDAISAHNGSTVVGEVEGTIIVGSNSFFTINGNKIMVSDGTLEIPTHQYVVFPPLFHSHSFVPDTLANSYFFIEGKLIVLELDSYEDDETNIKTAGSNSFFEVS